MWAASPAATRTTALSWWLAAREPAVRGNAQQLGPRSAHPEIVRTIPQLVILSSMTKLLRIKEEKGHLQLCQGLIWHGAPAMVAEWGSTRVVATTQTAWDGEEEDEHVHGSTTSLVTPDYKRKKQHTNILQVWSFALLDGGRGAGPG